MHYRGLSPQGGGDNGVVYFARPWTRVAPLDDNPVKHRGRKGMPIYSVCLDGEFALPTQAMFPPTHLFKSGATMQV